jgi:AAA domain
VSDLGPTEEVWTDVGDAAPEHPEWVVNNLIPTGITFLAGPPKSYKSTVELAAILTACGVGNSVLPPELSQCDDPGIVLGLSMEASAGTLRHTIKEGFGVDVPNDKRFLVMSDPWRFRLDQPQDVRELLDWCDVLHPKVLFIDPLRNCHSLDENDSGGMVHMLQPLQRYAVRNRMAVIIVHHSKKIGTDRDGGKRMAQAEDMRGTSALFGMADAVLTITAKGQGTIHIDGIFKRAESCQRTVQLGVWGTTPQESIDSTTKSVFEGLVLGKTHSRIAADLEVTAAQVSTAVTQLKRIGALTGNGKPTLEGSSIVSSAVRKFAKSI